MRKNRDYKREYLVTDGKPKAKKDRAHRNKARRRAIREGWAKKGDGKDVDHRDGNPQNDSRSNLRLISASRNRSKK